LKAEAEARTGGEVRLRVRTLLETEVR
jgi:hypothetical protein